MLVAQAAQAWVRVPRAQRGSAQAWARAAPREQRRRGSVGLRAYNLMRPQSQAFARVLHDASLRKSSPTAYAQLCEVLYRGMPYIAANWRGNRSRAGNKRPLNFHGQEPSLRHFTSFP